MRKTLAEWVRPTADIDRMLAEIQRGDGSRSGGSRC
jgi:hypothetical protein